MFNSTNETKLLGRLCRTVEASGGIEYSERCMPVLIADPSWTDLAYLYVETCRELGITIRGSWGPVQHYWLPDGTLLRPALLDGVRQILTDEKPLTENAEAQLRHVLQVFDCTVNDFEVQQILEWCREAEPPGLFLRTQGDTLEWAPPDLIDLNTTLGGYLTPGEINKLLRVPWYIPEEPVLGREDLVLVSASEMYACLGSGSVTPIHLLKPLGIQSVVPVEDERKNYADERFFAT